MYGKCHCLTFRFLFALVCAHLLESLVCEFFHFNSEELFGSVSVDMMKISTWTTPIMTKQLLTTHITEPTDKKVHIKTQHMACRLTEKRRGCGHAATPQQHDVALELFIHYIPFLFLQMRTYIVSSGAGSISLRDTPSSSNILRTSPENETDSQHYISTKLLVYK